MKRNRYLTGNENNKKQNSRSNYISLSYAQKCKSLVSNIFLMQDELYGISDDCIAIASALLEFLTLHLNL